MPQRRGITLALATGLVALLGGAVPPPDLRPPARPADVPAADWPFLPDGSLRHGGDIEISTPTTTVSRHGDDIEISTPTGTFAQHGDNIEISTPTRTIAKHGDRIEISTPTGTVVRYGDDDDDTAEAKPVTRHHSSSSSSSNGGGVIGIGVLALCAYFARKAWRRRRQRPFDAMARPAYRPRAAGFDPRERVGDGAAEAVLEQLLRLERRLAMIETAVTSSEFELQRGFSALEPGGRS